MTFTPSVPIFTRTPSRSKISCGTSIISPLEHTNNRNHPHKRRGNRQRINACAFPGRASVEPGPKHPDAKECKLNDFGDPTSLHGVFLSRSCAPPSAGNNGVTGRLRLWKYCHWSKYCARRCACVAYTTVTTSCQGQKTISTPSAVAKHPVRTGRRQAEPGYCASVMSKTLHTNCQIFFYWMKKPLRA